MLDMRLYRPSGIYEDVQKVSEEMDRVVPDDPTASGMEVIAGKVVKFLLTEKGSDAFNPDYGGTSMHWLQIAPQSLPQFKREVFQDVQNCIKFLKVADLEYNVDSDRLETINILRVAYDPIRTPNRVDVYLEIITTQGKRAVVAITPRTGS